MHWRWGLRNFQTYAHLSHMKVYSHLHGKGSIIFKDLEFPQFLKQLYTFAAKSVHGSLNIGNIQGICIIPVHRTIIISSQ